MKVKTQVVLVLVMITSLLATSASAGAQEFPERNPAPPPTASEMLTDLPDVEAPRVGDPVDDAELEDLTTFANQRGISVDQAVTNYAWRFDFSLLASEIRELSPNSYTYAKIVGNKNALIHFSSEMPQEAATLIENFQHLFPDTSILVQTNYGLNETEINAALEAVHLAVFNDAGDAVSRFDHETRQIRITVPSTAIDNVSSLTQAATIALARQPIENIEVQLSVSSSFSLSQEAINTLHRGGEALSQCTSGFTFVHSGNLQRRGSTAAHCGNSLSDDGKSLMMTGEHNGIWGDWQLHVGPDPHTDDFYAGTTTVLETTNRDTSSPGVPVDGQVLCKNGKVGFKDCDTVRDPSMCAGANCYLIEMDNSFVKQGDSGGPVFYSRTAYGGVKGFLEDSNGNPLRDLHSRQDSVHEIWYHYYIATT